ncbi:ABC transporter substrate-binding protein [Legionella qingyii]|uniref:ABC transporter substrate-binding protein n=1 Tax=Legionella qingyii TaxID=2184757 RepID=A0A317U6V1_9GAMM|nr:transporter substrate-binding domain-containing protein [Legionella qingyii]PWY56477.1 ABC transporter substrate-binding protein [Legionella qingyii]PWY57166.1 ABC transporter substrate-binding protein [Legionella qingyii]RUR24994.1 transporter substrate-binding domain-containing protein [Legionella qingyii]RUR28734.1 transporter substrate-binding domain-containing protein [Legionella qingyii]
MKLFRHIVFITLLASSLFAYGSPLVVGVLKFAPPFSSTDSDNHYFGFSVDLMDEICNRIATTCIYKPTDLDSQFKDLDSGYIDITFLPSPLPSTQLTNYVFSLPYITSRGQFISLKNSNITSVDDIKNKKIGALQATFIQYNVLPNYTSKQNIKAYSKITSLIGALSNHDIDVALVNENVAKYLLNNALKGFQLVGKPIVMGNGYGIIALKKNAAIIDKINKALLQIETDGTYLTIYNKYFGN